MKTMRLVGTTNSSGAVTVKGERTIVGQLVAVQWIDGTLSDGVDFVLSTSGHEASNTLLTVANADADKMYYPREIPHKTEDGAVLTATAGGDRVMPLIAGVPQLAITNGGDAHTGGCLIFYEE